jgi:nitrite reductase/ring-hydroxylating ferredoxin subunit
MIDANYVATVDLGESAESGEIGRRAWPFDYLDAFGRPASGVLLRIGNSPTDLEFKAYRNLCPHWSMPLDDGTGEFFDDSGRMLQCKMHGAQFEPRTGECVMGPCDGEHLEELRVELSPDGKTAKIRRGRGLKLG